MSDIVLGIAIIITLSLALMFAGVKVSHRLSRNWSVVVTMLALGLMAAYSVYLRNSAQLSRMLPFSNLIVVGNWFPLFGGFVCGVAWRRIPGGLPRHAITVVPLYAVCIYSLVSPLRGELPHGENLWLNGISIQTSRSTCSAACAATLLHEHGISASEKEMIDLCLTRTSGTSWYGLYRGLKLKTQNTPWDVRLMSCDVGTLLNTEEPRIISVRLDKTPGLDPRYEREWGWIPGVQHSVILFGRVGNHSIRMGDPAAGREQWNLKTLTDLWHGEAIELVRSVK
jgi:hypothetical protein